MPIYEYACRACGHAFETMQKASESRLTVCPACGQPELRKLLSAPVFRLKGGGWYETDFKSGDKKRNLAETTAESGTGDAKSDSGAKSADAASKGNGDSKKPASDAGAKSSNASSTAGKATT